MKEAEGYHKQGIQLLHTNRLKEAVDFFSKAVGLDPDNPDPYHYRGQVYTMLGRIVEANADIEKAKGLRSGRVKRKKCRAAAVKYDWGKIENLYDDLLSNDEVPDYESVDFDTSVYDYVFSDDCIENPDTLDELIVDSCKEGGCRAVLIAENGGREEVKKAFLFHPSQDEITLIDNEGRERIISLDRFCCIRLAAVPDGYVIPDSPGQTEIIETVDGIIHYQFVPAQQQAANGILTRSTKENSLFPYTFFPNVHVLKRSLERHLGEILVEKRYISNGALKDALSELQQLRAMKIGKIIAQQAQLHYMDVEREISKGSTGGREGLRTGEILVDAGLVQEEQMLKALETQECQQNKKIGEFLVEKGILQERELFISLAEQLRIPFLDLRRQKVAKKVLTMLPPKVVVELKVLPVALREDVLVVAVQDPDFSACRAEIARHVSAEKIEFVLVQPTHLKNVINVLFKKRRSGV